MDTVLTDNSQGANQNPSGQQNTTQAGSSSQPQGGQGSSLHTQEAAAYDPVNHPRNRQELADWLDRKRDNFLTRHPTGTTSSFNATSAGICRDTSQCRDPIIRQLLYDSIYRHPHLTAYKYVVNKTTETAVWSHVHITKKLIKTIRDDTS